MKSIRRRRGEQGNQLIELALILPLLLLMALMVGEGAQVLRAHIVINNAAREGARFSVQPENDCITATAPGTCISAIQGVVITYAANNGITLTPGNVTVNQTMVIPAVPADLQASQVTVTYAFPLAYLPPFMGAFFGGTPPTVPMVGQAEFRNMY